MKKWTLIVVAAVLAALVALNGFADRKTEADVVYPMANAGIEWSGAGYSGIYGK